MTKKKPAGAKPRPSGKRKVAVANLVVDFHFADGPARAGSAIELGVKRILDLALMARSEDPDLRAIGISRLREFVTQSLESDPAVRRMRAMSADVRVRQLVEYAKKSGYPPARGYLPRFLEAAAKDLGASERQVERWLAAAKKGNLLP